MMRWIGVVGLTAALGVAVAQEGGEAPPEAVQIGRAHV